MILYYNSLRFAHPAEAIRRLGGSKGSKGPKGPKGPKRPKGPKGPKVFVGSQNGPEMVPGWPQHGAKMAPRWPKMAQDAPR